VCELLSSLRLGSLHGSLRLGSLHGSLLLGLRLDLFFWARFTFFFFFCRALDFGLTSAREWASVPQVGASWALLPSTTKEGEPGAGTISPQSRDCVDGTERLPFSSNPPERAGLRYVQARGTSSVTTPEGLEGRSPSGRRALREVTFFSFPGVLCKCLWEAPSLVE